jgi:B-box zinc finger
MALVQVLKEKLGESYNQLLKIASMSEQEAILERSDSTDSLQMIEIVSSSEIQSSRQQQLCP